jgi:hypothetical protein
MLSVDKLLPTLINHHIKAICTAIGDGALERIQTESLAVELSHCNTLGPEEMRLHRISAEMLFARANKLGSSEIQLS